MLGMWVSGGVLPMRVTGGSLEIQRVADEFGQEDAADGEAHHRGPLVVKGGPGRAGDEAEAGEEKAEVAELAEDEVGARGADEAVDEEEHGGHGGDVEWIGEGLEGIGPGVRDARVGCFGRGRGC